MMAARSSGLGSPTDPAPQTRWAMMPKFFVRTTTLSRPMVSLESLVKSLSDTSSALASECSIIMSSSSPEKSGRMGTTTMPAAVTAK